MNPEEKKRFTKMEDSIENIQKDMSIVKSALVGNEMSGDRGVVGQVSILKAEIDFLKKDLLTVQNEAIENRVVIKQLKFVTGALITGVIGLLFLSLKSLFT